MRRGALWILLVVAVALLGAWPNECLGDEPEVTIPEVTEAHRVAFAEVEVIKLTLEEDYDKHGEDFEVGVREAVVELLEAAGLQVVEEGECDAEVVVRVSATPRAADYLNAGRRWSGGEAEVEAALVISGLPALRASSAEVDPCSQVIVEGTFRHAEDSPAWRLARECSRRSLLALLLALDPQACNRLLREGGRNIRPAACEALGKIGAPAAPAVAGLIEALKDEHEEGSARYAAAVALGKIGPSAAVVPAFLEALKDEEFTVRRAGAGGLGEIGPGAEAAVPALIEA
ncbi:MAG: HEAT repeat domain-containing protein, partial [Proteobacteria bacterium]|nr:HEAT repeat domain-containing protein [Pseudomonadota bacterium]